MVIGVRQLQRKKWTRQPVNELCNRARQPMDNFYTRVRQFTMEDLCVGVRQLQLGVRHLNLEEFCVGVRRLKIEDSNRS